jgi:hypothetical protein
MMEQRYELLKVGPETALELLAKNTSNRKVSPARVQRYAAMMALGQWRTTMAEPVTVNSLGQIQDGQHRLLAIVASETTMMVWVAYGADPEDFSVIGAPGIRSVADVLSMQGLTHVTWRAASAKLVLRYERMPEKVWSGNGPLTEVTRVDEEIEAARPEYGDVIPFAGSARSAGLKPTTAMASSVLILRYSSHPEDLESFMDCLSTGANLDHGSPILTLRNWATNSKGQFQGSWDAQRRLAIYLRVWNAWSAGESLKLLKFNQSNLPMPKVL